jgi:ribosomal protein S18 acetylase RimI-like enzyme
MARAAMRPSVEAQWGWDEERQRRLHARRFPKHVTEILLVGDEPVGLRVVERDLDGLRLLRLHVVPARQSRGIGGSVLRALRAEAAEAGLPIRLRVLRVNPRARSFYERHGFRVVGRTDVHHLMELPPPGDGRP